jgi:hypothetical protein
MVGIGEFIIVETFVKPPRRQECQEIYFEAKIYPWRFGKGFGVLSRRHLDGVQAWRFKKTTLNSLTVSYFKNVPKMGGRMPAPHFRSFYGKCEIVEIGRPSKKESLIYYVWRYGERKNGDGLP